MIDYQNTGDVKARVLRIADSRKRIENEKVLTLRSIQTKSFFDLQYKKLLVDNIQTIKYST